MAGFYLFDLDGTLVDRLPSLERFLPEQYRRYGADQLAEDFTRRFLELEQNGYAPKDEVYGTLVREFKLNASVAELIADFRHHAFNVLQTQPGASEVLGQLRQRGSRLGVVTNGSAVTQKQKLKASGLGDLLDFSLISKEVGTRKPEPEIFLAAARRFDVTPSSCVFVGDHPEKDIVGAGQVGMQTVWLQYGRPWPPHLEPPTFVVSRLQDLLTLHS